MITYFKKSNKLNTYISEKNNSQLDLRQSLEIFLLKFSYHLHTNEAM